ncbi:MAG TPA: tRNA 2-thiocytidine(32) synthetase TtcA, partial [Methylothermaceae bacterium]|nr:tRNA 2-thiocytidine(32) synthetase TtcA [Methylothermaceae bacterium]
MDFPVIPCNLCGSQDNLQRQAMKAMLQTWEQRHPGRLETIFRALQNVSPSQLADRQLFNFTGLEQKRLDGEPISVSDTPLDWREP